MTDQKRVVEKALHGDKAAVEELIDLFYERIFAFLRRLTANEEDAADLTQRTFSRVWQALPGFAGRSSVGSWIHGIAYHVYVDWVRGNHRTESRSAEWWVEQVCRGPGPDEVAARNDLAERLYASVDKLAPELRDTIHLHYYQELTLQETADAMGVATSTVKYRQRQALDQLENEMNRDRALAASPVNKPL